MPAILHPVHVPCGTMITDLRHSLEPLEPRTLLAAGELDPTFGNNGLFTHEVSMLNPPRAIAAQPDGALLVVADGPPTPTRTQRLYRIAPDGTLDQSFNDSGIVTLSPAASPDPASILVYPDGAILVGHSDGLFQLTRLNPDGAPDPTFGDDGIVRTHVPGFDPTHSFGGFAFDADGKIIVIGTIQKGAETPLLALLRYNPDGTLDTTFDADGVATTPLLQTIRPAGVSLLPDGRIAAAASSHDGTRSHVVLLRFHPDGSPDDTFDNDGLLFAPLTQNLSAEDFLIDSAGRWIVGASTQYTAVLLRFLPDGTLDATFGTNGKAEVLSVATFGVARRFGLALLTDDNFILSRATPIKDGGTSGCGPDSVGPARFTVSGTLDRTFGVIGTAQSTTPLMATSPDIALLPDGRIAVVGSTVTYPNIHEKLLVARYDTTGVPLVRLSPDGTLTVTGTDADDVIELSSDINGCGGYGSIAATINGVTHLAPAWETTNVRIDAGPGNDTVRISGTALPTRPFPFTVSTGEGDDSVTHAFTANHLISIDAAAGNDRLTIESTGTTRPYPNGEVFALRDGAITGARPINYSGIESLHSTGIGSFDVLSPPPPIALWLTGRSLAIAAPLAGPLTFRAPPGRDADLYVGPGSYAFEADAALTLGNSVITAGTDGTITFNGDQHLRSLQLQGGKIITTPGRHVLTVAPPFHGRWGLSFDPTAGGTLDLADNKLIYQQESDPAYELSRITAQIRRARNHPSGPWQGPGLTSSTARANPLTTLAAMINPGFAHFSGQVLNPTDILITHTWNGDANLDRRINADDYFRIDQGFLVQPVNPTYRDGDFNYDGTINADDYFLIDQAFLGQTTPLPASLSSPPLTSTPTPRTTRPTSDPAIRPTRKPRHIRPKQIYELFA